MYMYTCGCVIILLCTLVHTCTHDKHCRMRNAFVPVLLLLQTAESESALQSLWVALGWDGRMAASAKTKSITRALYL